MRSGIRILAGGDQAFPIPAEANIGYGTAVSLELGETPAANDVQQHDSLVLAARGQYRTIRAESQARYSLGVAGDGSPAGFAVAAFQKLTVPSEFPEATSLPSGLKETVEASPSFTPVSVRLILGTAAGFQRIRSPSRLPEANPAPTGLKATLSTGPRCPVKSLRLCDPVVPHVVDGHGIIGKVRPRPIRHPG